MSTVPTVRRSRRVTLAAVTTALLAALASTGASASTAPVTTEPSEPELDMAGNEIATTPIEPMTLTATYELGLERPRGQVLQRFVEEVEAESGGAITIDVTVENPDSIQQWTDGDFDITLTPTRTLDTMGVTTFDVLSLPFLVQDDDQADRVATSDAANVMMAGLSPIDATGLVLAPVSQNHLAIYGDEPLRTLDQLQTGIRVYSPSNRIDQLYAAIGGHTVPGLSGDDWHDAIMSGEVLAADFPTALATAFPERMSMATNFTIYYEFGVVMIRNDSLDELSPEQVDVLQAAGAATVQRQIDERLREEDAFAQACSEGATLTAAPYSLMSEVGDALDEPILEMLEDPAIQEIYDAVRTAAGVYKVPAAVECANSEVSDYVPPDPPSTTFPEGVYRVPGSTREQLSVRGVPRVAATDNAADFIELTIEDGTATLVYYREDGPDPPCVVPYTIDDTGLIVLPPDGCASGTYTWWETADGIGTEWVPPGDNLDRRFEQWEVAMIGYSHLVRVE